jgi:hypothetical protein
MGFSSLVFVGGSRKEPRDGDDGRRPSDRNCRVVAVVDRDGAQLIGTAGIGGRELARHGERLVEIGNVDHVEAQQLLLGLGEGAIDDERRILRLAQGRGRGGRQKTKRRSELARLHQTVPHHGEPPHDGLLLLLAPGTDDVFLIVTKDGVKHALCS